jgi:DNA modification methylase
MSAAPTPAEGDGGGGVPGIGGQRDRPEVWVARSARVIWRSSNKGTWKSPGRWRATGSSSLPRADPTGPTLPLPDVQPWEYSGNISHPTEKAVSVLRPLVESFCPAGGVVLDALQAAAAR